MLNTRRVPKRSWIGVLALLSSGCTVHAWERTREICGLAQGETLSPSLLTEAGDGGRHGLVVETACAESLLKDIGADPATLRSGGEGGDDLGAYLEQARLATELGDGLPVAVWGLYWLLGADYGSVGDLESGPYVDEVWVQELQQGIEGDSPLGSRLYNLVASTVKRVEFLEDIDAPEEIEAQAASSQDGTLYIPRQVDTEWPDAEEHYGPERYARVFIHEFAHLRPGGFSHVFCGMEPGDTEGRSCDVTLAGAHGLSIAVAWSEALVATRGRGCLDRAGDPDGAERARSIEYYLEDKFRDVILIPPPERGQLSDCP